MSAKCLSGNGTLVKYLFGEIVSAKLGLSEMDFGEKSEYPQLVYRTNFVKNFIGSSISVYQSIFRSIRENVLLFGQSLSGKRYARTYVGKSQCTETIPF